jgi:hypothetical protein
MHPSQALKERNKRLGLLVISPLQGLQVWGGYLPSASHWAIEFRAFGADHRQHLFLDFHYHLATPRCSAIDWRELPKRRQVAALHKPCPTFNRTRYLSWRIGLS